MPRKYTLSHKILPSIQYHYKLHFQTAVISSIILQILRYFTYKQIHIQTASKRNSRQLFPLKMCFFVILNIGPCEMLTLRNLNSKWYICQLQWCHTSVNCCHTCIAIKWTGFTTNNHLKSCIRYAKISSFLQIWFVKCFPFVAAELL